MRRLLFFHVTSSVSVQPDRREPAGVKSFSYLWAFPKSQKKPTKTAGAIMWDSINTQSHPNGCCCLHACLQASPQKLGPASFINTADKIGIGNNQSKNGTAILTESLFPDKQLEMLIGVPQTLHLPLCAIILTFYLLVS